MLLDLVFVFLVGSLAAWGVARLWLSPAEIGARLGRAWRALAAGPVGRFAVRHRRATVAACVLGGLALLPFVATGALVLLGAAVLAPAFAAWMEMEEEETTEGALIPTATKFYHPETGLPMDDSGMFDVAGNPYPTEPFSQK